MTREHIEFVLSEYSTDALAGKLLELFDEEAASYQHTINKLNKALSENKGEDSEIGDVLDRISAEINTPNRGTCDYFIVDRIEQIISEYREGVSE